MLLRDMRSGELLMMMTALVMAVGIIATLSLFTDRLNKSLLSQSSSFLGADRIISGPRPPPEEWLQIATENNLVYARMMRFTSMVFESESERSQLVAVRAVSPGYPLRGSLEIASQPFLLGTKTTEIPDRGEVWIDSRLFPSLGIKPGDKVGIGDADFLVSKAIIKEPGSGVSLFNMAPRVIMNMEDIAATGIIKPGSRVRYDLLLNGRIDDLESYRDFLNPNLEEAFRWRDFRNESQGFAEVLRRTESFFLLGGLLGLILAGIAISLAAQRYAKRHYDYVAIFKTLGQSSVTILFIYLSGLTLLGIIATLGGIFVGLGLQFILEQALAELLKTALPAPGLRPFIISFTTGIVCLFAFAVPPMLQVKDISPLRIFRRDLNSKSKSSKLSWVLGGGGSLTLLLWYSGSIYLTGWVMLGTLIVLVFLLLLAELLLRSGKRAGMQAGASWRLALAGLQRRHRGNSVQMVAFGMAFMLLSLMVFIRSGLINEWQTQLPQGTPNHFVINIGQDEVDEISEVFSAADIKSEQMYPMIRGRISDINDRKILAWIAEKKSKDDINQDAQPERNLSFSQDLPMDNSIISGSWWNEESTVIQISLEEGFANMLHVNVGSKIRFQVADQIINTEVSSIRRVKWDSFRPNFFILFPPKVLDKFIGTWVTSFYLPAEKKLFLNELLGRFPAVSIIDIDSFIIQVKLLVEQMSKAIEFILAMVLSAGVMVLVASIFFSMDERSREYAIIRTIGCSNSRILWALIIEFCTLGLFSGIMAIIGAEIAYYGLLKWVFFLDFSPHFLAWLGTPLTGLVVIGIIGTAITWKVIRVSPTMTLRTEVF